MEKINDNNFEKEVVLSTTPVLVKFGAPWCEPCKTLDIYLKDIETRANIKIVEMDVSKNQSVPQDYMVASVPTVMLFKDGVPVKNRTGLADRSYYERMIDD